VPGEKAGADFKQTSETSDHPSYADLQKDQRRGLIGKKKAASFITTFPVRSRDEHHPTAGGGRKEGGQGYCLYHAQRILTDGLVQGTGRLGKNGFITCARKRTS